MSMPTFSATPEELVRGLDDLHRGLAIQLELIALGPRAIEPLAAFLLRPPTQHPQPRMLAAEALGAIGGARAVDVLIHALLRDNVGGLPLELRMSEESVRSTIARELGRVEEEAAVAALLDALERFHLVEAGRVLASQREVRALSLLVECLDDPFIRARAADAICQFGDVATDALLEGLRRREIRDGMEVLRSIERREACARLLGEIGHRRAEPALRRYANDPTLRVRLAAALAVGRLAPESAGDRVIALLVEGLRSEDPPIGDDYADALATVGSRAVAQVAGAFALEASRAEARGEPVPPPALRTIGRALARLGERGLVALVAFTRHPSPLARGVAVANLARADSTRALQAIADAVHDPDPRVRRTARACRDRRARHRDG